MLLLDGIGVTIRVSLVAVLIGIAIGLLIALCNLSSNKLLKLIGGIYTDVIRGTPSVTQLMIIYFVIFASVNLSKWIIAAIAFGINSGAYVSEIIRAGILSVDKGQTEAGRSLGLSASQTMTRIVIPQAVKNIFPAHRIFFGNVKPEINPFAPRKINVLRLIKSIAVKIV